ncbi:MAG: tRNA (adenosine(37)-N6)-threonylcarbamoyltransferase complex ATPase subunit type 1 TsaE [Rhodospirillales bacterium]|nr:tRNA (adenosine(37)-N6)-threonylcarbamoyltransferase complex ATPase subunit type 1 TsaE [Alphaproteobacteria bacterium]MCB1840686.1 tRNA (adenosine(37)-N6)-threonylcarbamoyltransferase complex ATPase subunit type 1 TsaE [Alphaproteobacteria bacterium]MCB9977608.1 tRNA (adenosine(37)-N6)-threonylcarbamoyltransferase complex ATPase subunit type 1 TsaE [Rhodospirillales bacterium]
MEHFSQNEAETEALARDFARGLQGGETLCLYGELGAGKSVFCRALIRTLCGHPEMEVPSPTFTLAQVYDGYPDQAFPVWHFDLYRLVSPEEVYEIGWEEAIGQALCLIEWPERLGRLLPSRRTDVTLVPVPGQPNHRAIRIERHE